MNALMKGGHILVYEITVVLGSIPFVVFLTWQARVFGLTRRSALIVAICLCGDVMLFNWAFRSGWIVLWLLSIAFFFIFGLLLPKVQKTKSMDNALASKIDVYTEKSNKDEITSERPMTALSTESIEMLEEFQYLTQVDEPSEELSGPTPIDEPSEELSGPTPIDEPSEELSGPTPIDEPSEELSGPTPIDEPSEELSGPTPIDEPSEELSGPTPIDEPSEELSGPTPIDEPSEELSGPTLIDELVEQGFKEKDFDNFEQAAYFFTKALSLDPTPDLAFYLIIDCYWLWNNLKKRDYALTQLQVYILKYLPQFNSELRHQFDAWMLQENIHYVK